jgi:hypothetical protein
MIPHYWTITLAWLHNNTRQKSCQQDSNCDGFLYVPLTCEAQASAMSLAGAATVNRRKHARRRGSSSMWCSQTKVSHWMPCGVIANHCCLLSFYIEEDSYLCVRLCVVGQNTGIWQVAFSNERLYFVQQQHFIICWNNSLRYGENNHVWLTSV